MIASIKYSVVVPVYNQEQIIKETYRRLKRVMEDIGEYYELLFVNDGSKDNSIEIIEKLAKIDHCVKIVDLSRNFGDQIAITAGMDHAIGNAIVIIDANLQDPPELIPRMIEKWEEGYEIVSSKRCNRKDETFLKKWADSLFDRTMHSLTGVNISLDTGNILLIDKKVCEAMQSISEKKRFVSGLVGWVGFRQTAIKYVREERFANDTRYPIKKMLSFFIDGIIVFSNKPLKAAMYIGIVVFLASVIYLLVGSAPLTACMLLLNGIILILLGILGEYIGRIYDETKNRPLYILRNNENNQL